MADFKRSLLYVLENEGPLTDDPVDPGGATKYGISLAALKGMGHIGDIDGDGDIDRDDIWSLTEEKAGEIYAKHYWRHDGIKNDTLAAKAFDLSVLTGLRQATKLLQRAAGRCAGTPVTDDGVLGPKTLAVVNGCEPEKLMRLLCYESIDFYLDLIRAKPRLRKYRNGWLSRAKKLPDFGPTYQT